MFPAKSPTVVSICATATRRGGRRLLKRQGMAGEPVGRRRRVGAADRPDQRQARRRGRGQRAQPSPERGRRRDPGAGSARVRGRAPRAPCPRSFRTAGAPGTVAQSQSSSTNASAQAKPGSRGPCPVAARAPRIAAAAIRRTAAASAAAALQRAVSGATAPDCRATEDASCAGVRSARGLGFPGVKWKVVEGATVIPHQDPTASAGCGGRRSGPSDRGRPSGSAARTSCGESRPRPPGRWRGPR